MIHSGEQYMGYILFSRSLTKNHSDNTNGMLYGAAAISGAAMAENIIHISS
jgi:hypothetical protein